jgi:hypothetical protein
MKHKRIESSSLAWISLLWAQYNKLSEPLKEGFINLAQSMAVEIRGQNVNKRKQELRETGGAKRL